MYRFTPTESREAIDAITSQIEETKGEISAALRGIKGTIERYEMNECTLREMIRNFENFITALHHDEWELNDLGWKAVMYQTAIDNTCERVDTCGKF